MKTKTLQAFIGFTGQCAIAMLGLGCAQIFGFDKTYESEGEGSGGGTVGSGEPSVASRRSRIRRRPVRRRSSWPTIATRTAMCLPCATAERSTPTGA
ncbi:hypothetical protein [Sorangium sp. So ce513]|uniref:hypothetical protein n=1 Tax=Sorangium sp. So ce513 TaxID=3133315 RepID=UPI003F608935